MDLESLSDGEIRSKCAAHGIKVGPLTATTRKLYLKKLAGAWTAPPTPPNGSSTPIKPARPTPTRAAKPSQPSNPVPSINTHSVDPIRSVDSVEGVSPSSLSDDELRTLMRSLNIRFGPVNAMTRKIYYKKIKEAQRVTIQNGVNEFSTDDDDTVTIGTVTKTNGGPATTNGTSTTATRRPKKKRDSPHKTPTPPAVQEAYSTSESEDEEDEEDSSLVLQHDMGTSVMSTATLDDSYALHNDSVNSTTIRTPLRDRNHSENIRPSPVPFSSDPALGQNSTRKSSTAVLSPLANSEIVSKGVNFITKPRTPLQTTVRHKRTADDDLQKPERTGRTEPGPATLAAYNRLNGTRAPGEQPERKRPKNVTQKKHPDELAGVYFANKLPLIVGIFFGCLAVGYCLKTGINILPDITNDITDEVVDDPPIQLPSWMDMKSEPDQRMGNALIDIFYTVQEATVSDLCHIPNILMGPSAGDKSVHLSSIELGEDIKNRVLKIILEDENVSKVMKVDDDGYLSVDKSTLDVSYFCEMIISGSARYIQIRWAFIILLLTFSVKMIFDWNQGRKEARNVEVAQMMKETVDVLQNNSARHGATRGIKREKVRDQIVPIGETCANNLRIWTDCEAMLKADSRLTIDQKVENGEECEFWKWTESTNINGDIWQGKAFATRGPSGADIPAECLKIRNMFDAADRDPKIKTRVTNAIKEWCKDVNGITHIDFSIVDGVVYVKCTSKEKAGIAYSRISANWYNKKLVTVKYILLDRYHKRFPKSATSTEILA